jgi:hypothetical protein
MAGVSLTPHWSDKDCPDYTSTAASGAVRLRSDQVKEARRGAFQKSWDGRGALTLPSLSPLAAFRNWRRFFVDFLRGMAPLRRGRYRCWSNNCGRNEGLRNGFISGFGDTCAQSQEAKRDRALRL